MWMENYTKTHIVSNQIMQLILKNLSLNYDEGETHRDNNKHTTYLSITTSRT